MESLVKSTIRDDEKYNIRIEPSDGYRVSSKSINNLIMSATVSGQMRVWAKRSHTNIRDLLDMMDRVSEGHEYLRPYIDNLALDRISTDNLVIGLYELSNKEKIFYFGAKGSKHIWDKVKDDFEVLWESYDNGCCELIVDSSAEKNEYVSRVRHNSVPYDIVKCLWRVNQDVTKLIINGRDFSL